MRILMLTHNMAGKGGSFMRSYSLAKGLSRMGHEVTLLAASREKHGMRRKEIAEGVCVVEVPDVLPQRVRHGGLSPVELIGRLIYVAGEDFDLVHGFDHRPSVSLPALFYRKWRGIPYVADWADLWGLEGIAGERRGLSRVVLGRFDDLGERWTHRWADGLTVANRYLMERAQAMGISAGRIRLVPAGSDVDTIRPLPQDAMRRKHGLPLEGRIAVHIGFAPYDAMLLAETFVQVAKRDPQAWLLLTGGLMPGLERIVRQSGVEGQVIQKGFVPYPQLGEYLACGDVMLLPYRNRGVNLGRYPNKVGDYLAAGRPIVSNPTGDLGRMIQEEGVGVVVEESPEAFADGIRRLFEDEEWREELGRRARYVAETKFSWQVLAGGVDGFYQDLLAERGGSSES